MNRSDTLRLVGFLCSLSTIALAQQFRISSFTNGEVVIEYPPSFAGAYLFVEQSSNLTSNVVWEAVDYTQVELVEGEMVYYSPPATNAPGASTNEFDVPYKITPEYIEAVSSGEIQNESWTAGTVWNSTTDGVKGFFRILGFSFVDTDGDGVDNVSEYAAGTDYGVPDAPLVNLPPDDGDPRPVPGSVASAPGDWNSPPETVYRASTGLSGLMNAMNLVVNGEYGTFTADSIPTDFGAWIEDNFWWFVRAETNGFSWAGKSDIYSLDFDYWDDSLGYVNHLIKTSESDPAGLAVLPDDTPVLVDNENPWTEEKVLACLEHLNTIWTSFQNVIDGPSGPMHDEADDTAMARVYGAWSLFPDPVPNGWLRQTPFNHVEVAYDYSANGGWSLDYVDAQGGDIYLEFTDNLERRGFGPTRHVGYVITDLSYDWVYNGYSWRKFTFQSVIPSITEQDALQEAFTCTNSSSRWFLGGGSPLWSYPLNPIYGPPWETPPAGEENHAGASSYTGVYMRYYEILSTFILPPMVEANTLVMDFDRDGAITTNDLDRVDASHPYRFWVNEDGNNATYPEADLEDFFPAQIHWREGSSMSNLTFKLSANVNLDYIPTSMTTNNTDAYLTELSVAGTLSGNIQPLSSGTQTTEAFNEDDIVLLAAADTNAQIYVHILQDGSEIAVSTNHFSFSPVEDMYRIMNLRETGTSSLDEPSNWPDDLTNGKDLVFVHGFNVDESAAENWHRNIFKRLWFAGSNAKYHGIIWDGIGQGSLLTHFQNSVVNSFATAPWLADYIQTLSGTETIVLGHSLGNMVVSAAICEHNAPVSQYYALDAAVALEAYGDTTNNTAFLPDVYFTWQKTGFLDYERFGWSEYPHETRASEWYRLFLSGDPRSELTWRHKFADIQEKTDVFNFYSSTEDVLRVRDDVNSILQLIDWSSVRPELRFHLVPLTFTSDKQCAWQLQEMYKGQNNWAATALGGGSSEQCGWGFTKSEGEHVSYRTIQGGPNNPTPITLMYASTTGKVARALSTAPGNETVRAEFLETLKTDPLFRPEPEILFEAGSAAFAGGIVGDYDAVCDTPSDLDVSEVPVRDWLLAKGFPSRTGPMGSGVQKEWIAELSFDMSDPNPSKSFMTDPNNWFDDDTYLGRATWHHSDWKNAPYVHVHKLFEKIVTKEE